MNPFIFGAKEGRGYVANCFHFVKIWARSTSTVGTGAEAKAVARDVPISIGGVTVSPVGVLRVVSFELDS
jgi:hypothetical protein